MALAAAAVAVLAAAAVAGPWVYATFVEPLVRCWTTRHIPGPPGHILWGCIPALLRRPSFRCVEQQPGVAAGLGTPLQLTWAEHGRQHVLCAHATHGVCKRCVACLCCCRVFRDWALQYGPVYRVRFILGRAVRAPHAVMPASAACGACMNQHCRPACCR